MGAKDRVVEDGSKRGQGMRPARVKQVDSEFINMELTAEQIVLYRVWRQDLDEVVVQWTALVEEGYRVNTKYDDYSSSCAAFIIPLQEGDNSGYILTGRGGNAYNAVSEAIYKHVAILRGDWSSYQRRPRPSDDPDF